MPMSLEHGLIERSIVREVVYSLLGQGYFLDVNDGEETTVKQSNTAATILAASFTTDDLILIVHDAAGKRFGVVQFIFGNGIDVIHDYSVTLGDALGPSLRWVSELEDDPEHFGIERLN